MTVGLKYLFEPKKRIYHNILEIWASWVSVQYTILSRSLLWRTGDHCHYVWL
jgi:hypothetical protein